MLKICAFLVAFSVASFPSISFAAPSVVEEEARSRLINEAKAAHTAKDHKKALELAERAASIQLTPSLRYFLAYEQEELGLLAEAFGNAQQCAREFELDASLPQRDTLLRICRALRDRLAARVGYLIVVPPATPQEIAVKIGGRVVNRALFRMPYLVTPGAVSIEATAPGYQPFRSEITVAPGPAVEVKIALTAEAVASAKNVPSPPVVTEKRSAAPTPCPTGQIRAANGSCVNAPPAPTPPVAAAVSAEAPRALPPAQPSRAFDATKAQADAATRSAGRPRVVYIAGVVGLVGLISGATFGAMTRQAFGDLKQKYDPEAEKSAKRINRAQIAGYAVGAIGLGVSLIAALTSSGSSIEANKGASPVSLSFAPTVRGTGVVWSF